MTFVWHLIGVQEELQGGLGAILGFPGKSGIGVVWGDLGFQDAPAEIERSGLLDPRPLLRAHLNKRAQRHKDLNSIFLSITNDS